MREQLDVVATLQQLVRIPSVNPMGREVHGEPYFEHRVTDFLQGFFEHLQVPWQRQTVAPLRDNIVARLDGDASDRGNDRWLVWEVHQDTVPVEGMSIDPWEPTIRAGRLYGRGACDDKGPMACMLTAFARLAQQRPRGRATVVIACTVNEEHGFSGARELVRAWSAGSDPLLPRLPDAMIVAEPTSLDVVVAHKGLVRWQCHTSGRAAHSSCPQQGENAIYHMGPVITALEQYATLLSDMPPHPLLGSPTISLGTIHGGLCVNTVPDRCTIELDRRLLPDEDPLEAHQAAKQWLSQRLPPAAARSLEHEDPFLTGHGLAGQGADPWAQRVAGELRALGAAPRLVGVPYGTDAPFFARLGIPTVVFGPGSVEQAHTVDEWVSLTELDLAVEAFYRLATMP